MCDFGVAGVLENKADKRQTITGTAHWMAPELFDQHPSYGKEVDIWALGCMIHEIATGHPPNVQDFVPLDRLGAHLKVHAPRLVGDAYSPELRNLMAFCCEEKPGGRPTIEAVQHHPYIHNTDSQYPTSSVQELIKAFRAWENLGGVRKSLFVVGGAQGPSGQVEYPEEDPWNFSLSEPVEREFADQITAEDVRNVYGEDVLFAEETAKPVVKPRRARQPNAEFLAKQSQPPAPLQKIFDPNTMTSYRDASNKLFGPDGRMTEAPASDLPLRDDSATPSIRDTMIDLGDMDLETGFSSFPDLETIKAVPRGQENDNQEYGQPADSDPSEPNQNRRTIAWKFPTMASADAEAGISRIPSNRQVRQPTVTLGSGGRPTLMHHPTEPVGNFAGHQNMERKSMAESLIDLDMSRLSQRESGLIDLDMSVPSYAAYIPRPDTSLSEYGESISGDSEYSTQSSNGDPFALERHASLRISSAEREPEIYVTSEPDSFTHTRDVSDASDFSASDSEAQGVAAHSNMSDMNYVASSTAHSTSDANTNGRYPMAPRPLIAPPSARVLSGQTQDAETALEFRRMLGGLHEALVKFREDYEALPVTITRSRSQRKRSEGNENGSA